MKLLFVENKGPEVAHNTIHGHLNLLVSKIMTI